MNRRFRAAVGVPSLLAVLASSLAMWRLGAAEELWGWWPLPFLLGVWGVAVALRQNPARLDLLAIATVAGLGLGLGFPPLPTWPLMIVGFAALLYLMAELDARGLGLRQLLWYGFHALVLYNVVATWWVANTSLAAGFVANYLNALLMCGPLALIFLARRYMPKVWLASAPVLWIGFEYVHFNWQIAWPWLALGHGLASTPGLAQWYSLTGVFGGSLYLTACAALLYRAVRRRQAGGRAAGPLVTFGLALVVPCLLSLLLGYSFVPTGPDGAAPRQATILAVQPNYEPHYVKFARPERVQLEEVGRLLADALGPDVDLVVLPETSFGPLDESLVEQAPFAAWWEALRADAGDRADLLAGLSTYARFPGPNDDPALRTQADGRGGNVYYVSYNTAVALRGKGSPEVYHKSKLVPGVEFLPYRGALFVFEPLVASLGGTTAGLGVSPRAGVFDYPRSGIRAAPAICYESIYGDYVADYVRAGANLLVVPTNDGWWDDTPGHTQHLQLGQLRAIETRRYLVQAANSGTSAFVDPWGQVMAATDYDEATALTGRVGLLEGETLYVRYGDVIGRTALGASGLLLLSLVAAGWGRRVGLR